MILHVLTLIHVALSLVGIGDVEVEPGNRGYREGPSPAACEIVAIDGETGYQHEGQRQVRL